MDYDKLIERLRKEAYGSDIEDLLLGASTALSTLQAENEKLRAEVESLKKEHCAGCSVPVVEAERLRDLNEAPNLRAELEQVKRERNAAVECVNTVYSYILIKSKAEAVRTIEKWRRGPKED